MSADAPATPFIHLLDERVVRVEGDDAREWINGQVTADLREPRPGSTYALVLTLQGRVQSDAWLSDEGEHLVMRLPEAAADAVLAHLDRYIIMEDVELEPDPRRVLHVAGPGAAARVKSAGLEGLATPRLDAEGVDLLLPEDGLEAARRALIEAGVDEVDEAGWERARIARGVPRWGRDFGADTLPQEAGLKHAVSFDKGCYLGYTTPHGGPSANMHGLFAKHWAELRDSGRITAEEFDATNFPQHYRTVDEFKAPLEDETSAAHRLGLRLETIETRRTPCPFATAWANGEYSSPEAFAKDYVPTLRSWSTSVFVSGLSESRPVEERNAIVEEFWGKYEAAAAADPAAHGMDYIHAFIVVRKESA